MRQHGAAPVKKKIIIIAAAVCILLIAGIVIATSSANSGERAQYKATRNTFLSNVSVDGIALDGMTYDEAWNAVLNGIQEWQKSWSLSVVCNGFTYATLTYASVGIQADYEQLNTLLSEAWAYGHSGGYQEYLTDVASLAQTPYEGYIAQKQGGGEQVDYLLSVIRDSVYRAPQDAALLSFDATNTQDPFTFQSSAAGQTIDVAQAKEEILRMATTGQGGTYEIPLQVLQPKVELSQVKESVSLLAEYSTAIDKHSTDARNDNIALAFSRINGTMLQNGDKFSFNKLVGKRNERNGFLTALGYISGELAEVIGGGVCQASTTIYAAALCAGMTIQSRTPHSIPVSYISLGQDATVNDTRGHEIDLTFTNKSGYPIYITCAIETNASGRLECVARIWGQALENGAYRKLESVITETLEMPEEIIRPDKDGKYVTYTNQRYKYSSGAEGYVVKTYLQRYQDGAIVSSTLISTDTYKARPDVYYVGVTER